MSVDTKNLLGNGFVVYFDVGHLTKSEALVSSHQSHQPAKSFKDPSQRTIANLHSFEPYPGADRPPHVGNPRPSDVKAKPSCPGLTRCGTKHDDEVTTILVGKRWFEHIGSLETVAGSHGAAW